jgi:hypothetical protein
MRVGAESGECVLKFIMSLGFILDMRRCFLANLRSEEISEFHDLQRHLSFMSNLTGSLHKISIISSNGRVGSGGGGKVRVPAVVVANCCLFETVFTVRG